MGPGVGNSALQPHGSRHIPMVHYRQVDIHTASAGGLDCITARANGLAGTGGARWIPGLTSLAG